MRRIRLDLQRIGTPLMSRVRRWREPRILWLGFVALHTMAVGVLLPQMIAGDTLGDLPLYREWAMDAFEGRGIVGVDEPWVYPILAWLPMGAANIVGAPAYLALWIAMIIALNALALRALLRTGLPGAAVAGWVWLGTVLVLSPVSFLRLEGVTAPIAIIALCWIGERPRVAGALLALATWIKVWPAAIIAAALITLRTRAAIVRSGILVSAGAALFAVLLGGAGELTSFLQMQTDRALQLEAPIATPWVWLAMLGVDGASVYQNEAIATREVVGPLDGGALLLSTPLMIAVSAAALVLAGVAVWARAASRNDVMLTAALTIASAMFVCNKVGSPQYMLWMLPIVAVGVLHGAAWWRRMAALTLALGLATTLVFPITYMALVDLDPWAVMLLSVRNVGLVVLLGMCLARLMRLSRFGSFPDRAVGDAADTRWLATGSSRR